MLGIKVMLMVAAGDPRRTWPGAGGGHTRRYIYRKTGCGGGFLRRVSSGPRHVGVLWDFGDVQVCVWHPASSWCRWFPTGAPRGPEGRPWPCLPPIQIDATLQGSHVVCGGLPLSDCIVVSRNRRSCCEVNRVSRSRCGRILVEVKTRAMPGDLVILTSAIPSTCEFGRPRHRHPNHHHTSRDRPARDGRNLDGRTMQAQDDRYFDGKVAALAPGDSHG